ncbi:MAG: hypothetical protein H7319_17055 [Spirosoma sp.]|nr:hypothetical protein [Spirosoma sp.]
MRLLTGLLNGILCTGLSISSYAQTVNTAKMPPAASTVSRDSLVQALIGTWEIDLRPSPDAAPYLKKFVVTGYTDDSLNGVFYDTVFSDGKINTAWGKIYFAFTTADRSGTYYHNGYLYENKLYGMSYSTGRGFVIPWFSVRKK